MKGEREGGRVGGKLRCCAYVRARAFVYMCVCAHVCVLVRECAQ